ncbi:PLP-dependent aminotransferase family protein [Kribbella sindirgiensis]|nr:PLP-dependent aminotransferase family protein [Kribbella sindirgiensis]
MRVSSVVRLPVAVDRHSPHSLSRQIVDQIVLAIESGALGAGSELPSSRALAQTLGISRSVALAAYSELFARDYLRSLPGSGTFVSDVVGAKVPAADAATSSQRCSVDFSPGMPNLERYPRSAWRSAWQAASYVPPTATHAPRMGLPQLREQVAAHLNRTRGIGCVPGQVMITDGLAQGLEVLAELAGPEASAVIEDPAHPLLAYLLERRRLATVPVPVGPAGIDLELLPASASLAVVTPSQQFPLGRQMPLHRRHELLRWAERSEVLLVELDIADELHSREGFVPCLASLDMSGIVAYLGTFEHALSRDLPLGYLVLPEAFGKSAETLPMATTGPTPLAQRAALELFSRGDVARYVNRLYRSYQEKRAVVRRQLEMLPVESVTGLFGNHVAVQLSPGRSAEGVSERLVNAGVLIPPASAYRRRYAPDHVDDRTVDSTLIVGFGHLTSAEIEQGLRALGRALDVS